jgi:hypothetical protein
VFRRSRDGWSAGLRGAHGSIGPIESGYYDARLRRVEGEWKIVNHNVLMDMPIAIPAP